MVERYLYSKETVAIKQLNKHNVALLYYKKNKIGENLSFLC